MIRVKIRLGVRPPPQQRKERRRGGAKATTTNIVMPGKLLRFDPSCITSLEQLQTIMLEKFNVDVRVTTKSASSSSSPSSSSSFAALPSWRILLLRTSSNSATAAAAAAAAVATTKRDDVVIESIDEIEPNDELLLEFWSSDCCHGDIVIQERSSSTQRNNGGRAAAAAAATTNNNKIKPEPIVSTFIKQEKGRDTNPRFIKKEQETLSFKQQQEEEEEEDNNGSEAAVVVNDRAKKTGKQKRTAVETVVDDDDEGSDDDDDDDDDEGKDEDEDESTVQDVTEHEQAKKKQKISQQPVIEINEDEDEDSDDDDSDDDVYGEEDFDKTGDEDSEMKDSEEDDSSNDSGETDVDPFSFSRFYESDSDEEKRRREYNLRSFQALAMRLQEERQRRHRTPRAKARKKKPTESRLEVIMEEKDIPSAPGRPQTRENDDPDDSQTMDERFTLADGAKKDATGGSANVDRAVKDRIFKLLNTGFHENSNEHEAQNAMKLAQKLMKRHNLSQAMLLQERDVKASSDDEVLKGGLVQVRIINRKTRKVAQMERWISQLCGPICDNFEVKCYHTVTRQKQCDVVFYGICTNAQLAAYAFKLATERIAQMTSEYEPTTTWVSTKSARLSYSLGIVSGIDKAVEACKMREQEERERKLERARLAVSSKEAYEESDDEEELDYSNPQTKYGETSRTNQVGGELDGNEKDEDSGDRGYSFPLKASPVASAVSNVASSSSTGGGVSPSAAAADATQPPTNGTAQKKVLSGEALQERLQELEKEEQAALVLVDHREKVAEKVLEERNIKLSKGRKPSAIDFDRLSYRKGVEDSKEIDINQRAIRDEVKVKTEK